MSLLLLNFFIFFHSFDFCNYLLSRRNEVFKNVIEIRNFIYCIDSIMLRFEKRNFITLRFLFRKEFCNFILPKSSKLFLKLFVFIFIIIDDTFVICFILCCILFKKAHYFTIHLLFKFIIFFLQLLFFLQSSKLSFLKFSKSFFFFLTKK